MKLSARDAPGYFAKPDKSRTGLLIYGADAMRVALRRQEVIAALVGPEGEAEMRLTRMSGAELRKDPALLGDAIKAQGFFPGPRVAFVEDASETVAGPILAALEDWAEGDAQVIVTAGALKPTSKLRKAFEAHPNAYAVGIYNEPPSREEIEATLAKAGLDRIGREAMTDILALSRALDPGDFRQTIEKLALYKLGDAAEVSPADVAACAPISTEAAVDDVLRVVAEFRADQIAPLMARLRAQGVAPVTLCIQASRHFRTLYYVAAHPGGISEGLARLRPPVFGPRRDQVQRQASAWGAPKLEEALSLITDTDLELRSAAQTAPGMALVERALMRLAMLGRRK